MDIHALYNFYKKLMNTIVDIPEIIPLLFFVIRYMTILE